MKTSSKVWVPTKELAEALGISSYTLRELRKQGEFIKGRHYIVVNPNSERPTYRWHLERVMEVYANNKN